MAKNPNQTVVSISDKGSIGDQNKGSNGSTEPPLVSITIIVNVSTVPTNPLPVIEAIR